MRIVCGEARKESRKSQWDLLMDWKWDVKEREKAKMTWRVELSFTNMGKPVGASALGRT